MGDWKKTIRNLRFNLFWEKRVLFMLRLSEIK